MQSDIKLRGVVRKMATYTKASFTATTKTEPASLSFAELMYPGMWLSEHEGEKAAGTPASGSQTSYFNCGIHCPEFNAKHS